MILFGDSINFDGEQIKTIRANDALVYKFIRL